jgi:bifunctional UDP-N-acetylglucosamine pyrophosphorylase/glucosamine-1-phosphate N-acetyltransferase
MQAVVLASGQGVRFTPLTDYLPKPLLPAANCPLLEHLFLTLEEAGITDVIVTTGHLASQLEDFLSNISLNFSLTSVSAPYWRQGPLASLSSAIPLLKEDEPFLLLPCDLFLSAQNIHLLRNASSDFALLFDSQQFRPGPTLTLEKNGQVTCLTRSSIPLANEFSFLPALRATPSLFDIMKWPKGDNATTVFEILQLWVEKGNPITGVSMIPGVWFDVDTPENLISLNYHLITTGWPPTPISHGVYLPPDAQLLGPVQNHGVMLGKQTRLAGPVLIGPGTCIGDNCYIADGTTLGSSTVVQDNSALHRCITLPQTEVPACVDLYSTILDTKGNVIR